MQNGLQDTLRAARDAAARLAWREAFELFKQVDAASALGPEDLEWFATSAFWTGHLSECIPTRERAYAAYVAASNPRRAGAMAVELAHDYSLKLVPSVAEAWLHRAARLLHDEPGCPEQGWLSRLCTEIAIQRGDLDQALEHARKTLEIGGRFDDRNLQATGLHDQGRALIAKGQLAEGLALVDEATAAAVSGELGLYATAVIYCNTIIVCRDLADYRRAGDWSEAAKRWCERQALTGFPGICRVLRAEVIRLRGQWEEADRELRRACAELRDFSLGFVGQAFREIGEIRLRMGDLAGAEEAFRQAHELGQSPQPGLAMLRLAEGKVTASLAAIRAALADQPRDRFARARLLPAAVEIAVAAGDLDLGRAAAEELAALASDYGGSALQAAAAAAQGRLHLAEGNAAAAREALRRACRSWQEVDAPYETSIIQLLLAEAYQAEGNTDDASLELQTAQKTFERLGATRDARRAAHAASQLADRRPVLSAREREVAALIAQGLSNREIAKALTVSERTADAHVQHILNKLGFSSRAQIAAWVAVSREVLPSRNPPAG